MQEGERDRSREVVEHRGWDCGDGIGRGIMTGDDDANIPTPLLERTAMFVDEVADFVDPWRIIHEVVDVYVGNIVGDRCDSGAFRALQEMSKRPHASSTTDRNGVENIRATIFCPEVTSKDAR